MGLVGRVAAWLGGGGGGGGGREVTVLVLGLDNSGKTSTLRALRPPAAAPPPPPPPPAAHDAPTLAPRLEHFSSGGVSFAAWDVGGCARHRALWERHYRAADAFIFVVDAADHLRLVVAREELALLVSHAEVAGRRAPLLVLANKSDAPHALSPQQVAAALCLERISDRAWHVCGTSAATGAGLAEALAWLARQLRDLRAAAR